MKWMAHTKWTRGRFLWACLVMPASYVLAACTGQPDSSAPQGAAGQTQATDTPPTAVSTPPAGPAQPAPTSGAQVLAPTPQCADDDDVTPAQTEGPYFTPNSPQRTSLIEPGLRGTKLVLAGYVLTTDCRPVARALLDFWQCDDAGQYDNAGYRLRGHQFSDADGRYQLETIVPGLYPGRTRHIHLKVQAPNRPVLTTQLYFPGEPRNASDGIFHRDLLMSVQDTSDGKTAAFNFVLNVG